MIGRSSTGRGEWTGATLDQFVAERGKSINPAKTPDAQFELYSVPSFPNKKPEVVCGKEIGSNKQVVQPRSVLLCKINPRINRTWVVGDFTPHPKIASTEWIVFSCADDIVPEFLCYCLQQNALRDFLAHNASGVGGSLMRVKASTLRGFPFSYPEPQEQLRIVAEIEKQFTRLEAGVAALRRVQANLKRYRAAVLKAACEGKLVPTEAELARQEGRTFETGETLLARILAERRENWQGRGRYKESTNPDSAQLPLLPEGWSWATPDQLSAINETAICAGPFGTIFKAHDFRTEGIPIIFLRHVSPGRYLTRKPGFMDEVKWEELFKPYSVFGGELLITKLGEPPGVCAIYPEGIGPAMVTPDVMKMTPNPAAALPTYLMHYFNSRTARDFMTGVAFGTTRLRLTLPIFREMPIPLPPLPEQTRIVAEVERRLSVVEELEAVVSANLQRATRLRQAILQKAFSGELVAAGVAEGSA